MALRILHLSDLHLTSNFKHVRPLLTNLLNSIEQLRQDGNIDLVIFTGDMIDKGGSSFDSISAAFSAFEELVIAPILEKLNLTKERFILIPGNHDTENDKAKTGILREFLHDNKGSIITLKNLNHNGYPEMLRARTKAFKEFEYTYYADTLKDDYQYSDFESNYKFHINGHTIGVTGLNAVWLCGLDDDKEFYLGADQIGNSQAFLNDCDIKIIASHIAYELLTEGERRLVKNLITKCYDLNLSGHTHASDDDFIISPDENFCMNIVASGTLYPNAYTHNEEYKNSFQVIDVLSSTEFKIRKYIQKQGVDFSLDLNFGKNGVWHRKYIAEIVKEEDTEYFKKYDNMFSDISDAKSLFEMAINEIEEITRTDYNQIILESVKEYSSELHVVAEAISFHKQQYSIVAYGGLIWSCHKTRKTIVENNVKELGNSYFCAVFETNSEICVPIIYDDYIYGVINSESEDKNYFSPESRKMLEGLARAIAHNLYRLEWSKKPMYRSWGKLKRTPRYP